MAALFSVIGYIGFGGDPDAYHLLGRYLKDVWTDPAHASLERVLQEEGVQEVERSYDIHVINVEQFRHPRELKQYLNTVMPILVLHAASYCVWDNPFSFVVLTSLISALALSYAINSLKLPDEDARWLIYNPVSIFFAATHFKEGITEALVLCFVATLFGRNQPWRAWMWVGLMLLFRTSFAAILACFYVFKYTAAGRLKPALLFVLLLAFLAVIPVSLGVSETESRGAGPIYSLIYYNQWTMKLLGPLLGLLLPMPLQILRARGVIESGLVFTAVYGCYYYAVGVLLILHLRYAEKSEEANRLLNVVIFVSLVIGFLFLGASGVKDRYFAPFFPVMIVALLKLSAVRQRMRAAVARG